MDAILSAISRFVDGFVELLKTFALWFLHIGFAFLKSCLNWIVDKACDIIEWFFLLIDFKNSLFDASLSWTSLPDQVIWILNQVGFDNGLIIITSAILIRITLNLIPTWATRV